MTFYAIGLHVIRDKLLGEISIIVSRVGVIQKHYKGVYQCIIFGYLCRYIYFKSASSAKR